MRRILSGVDLLDVRKLDTAIEAHLNRRLAPLGLTYVQGSLLGLLARFGADETSQNTIEGWLGLSRPTVTGILDRLGAKGLVTVRPSDRDRRRHRVLITAEGRRLADRVSGIVDEIARVVLDGFSAGETERFASLLHRAADNLRAEHSLDAGTRHEPDAADVSETR